MVRIYKYRRIIPFITMLCTTLVLLTIVRSIKTKTHTKLQNLITTFLKKIYHPILKYVFISQKSMHYSCEYITIFEIEINLYESSIV